MYKQENKLQTSIATSAVLSYLGWLASGPAATPAAIPMAKGRRVKGRSGGPSSSSSGGFQPTNRADVRVRPPSNTNVPSSVPKSIPNQIVWDVVKIDSALSIGTSLSEGGFAAQLSLHPQASSWRALYDQWTVPQMSVTFMSLIPPGTTANAPRVYTALDFDNIGALGSVAALEDFSTASIHALEPSVAFTRSIRPCCKPTLDTGTGVSRLWVDSGAPSTNFNGIRYIVGPTNNALTSVISVTFTIWFAFRNQI